MFETLPKGHYAAVMPKVSDEEMKLHLQRLNDWTFLGNALHKTYTFRGFRASIAFVNRVAEEASSAGHHPDIEIHFNRVIVSLSTHDEGGVTEKDLALAEAIDGVASPPED
jgi:4a-hydroxytetrahydrobiopterin dehydratase